MVGREAETVQNENEVVETKVKEKEKEKVKDVFTKWPTSKLSFGGLKASGGHNAKLSMKCHQNSLNGIIVFSLPAGCFLMSAFYFIVLGLF